MMILVVKCTLKDPATSCIEELLMPIERINGINISSREPVVLVTGSGARARMWKPLHVPA
jgi:hypothetical protein